MTKDCSGKTKQILNEFFGDRDKPIKFIIGTDWWTDCDDVVAMRVLAWAQQNDLIKIEGIGINACMEFSCASLDAFLTAEGCPNIKIGIDKEAIDFGRTPPYQKRMVSYPHTRTNSDCPDAVRLYREILANSKEKLDMIEIGYPQVLSNLLLSQADDISPHSGLELVSNKVNKLWIMAGNWEDLNHGVENNFARNARSREAGHSICKNWPTPVTFLGWEVSNAILTGDTLTSENDMLYNALQDHGSKNGRSSWDPMLVFLACCNNEEKAGYEAVRGTAFVDSDTGANRFLIDESGKHCFVKKKMPDDFYKDNINAILELKQCW